MGKTVGIPRGLFYYYYSNIWLNFFKELNIDVIVSPKTNRKIMEIGNKYASDEMCLSIKNYIGHVAYLKDKCDYILVPRIDNYGRNDQTCTNFLAMYDYISNIFDVDIINYNVNLNNKESEKKGLIKVAEKLGISKKRALSAYSIACIKNNKLNKAVKVVNNNKLNSDRIKILVIAHPYNVYDEYIGKPIIKLLEKMNVEIIYSDKFDHYLTNCMAHKISKDLYWKYSKELIGSIILSENSIDGIIFLSTFPCGLDSLVNELVMRKIKIPYLNIVIDDLDSLSGVETRVESFIDILEQKVNL